QDMVDRCYQDMVDTLEDGVQSWLIPPEPPVARGAGPERRGGRKGARKRGAANPCARAPFWHGQTRRAALAGSDIPRVSLRAGFPRTDLDTAQTEAPVRHPCPDRFRG